MQNQKSHTGVKASEGVSTLDLCKRFRLILTTLFLLALSTAHGVDAQTVRYGHSTLDILDPSFNAQLSTASYGFKEVRVIVPLTNGKILVGGEFNAYNGVATGGLVRLNADGTLDSSFYNNLIVGEWMDERSVHCIVPLADGKILVGGDFILQGETNRRGLVRLNSDGTLDTTFAYNTPPNASSFSSALKRILVRANGKIVLGGDFWATPSGNKGIVQLNPDGTFDTSFDYPATGPVRDLELQGDKVLVVNYANNLCRLNDDGSLDSSFTCRSYWIRETFVQASGKVIVHIMGMPPLFRLNDNGTDDQSFQNFVSANPQRVAQQSNGNIVVVSRNGGTDPHAVTRLLADGTPDSSFSTYLHNVGTVTALGVQPDGKVLLGDSSCCGNMSSNNFVRLNADGSRDTAFNSGGIGFQFMNPGIVRAIAVQPDNKIVIGGRFDLVNNVSRNQIARINEDGTPDNSFQISTTGENRFTSINSISQITLQGDGKMLVSGSFSYVVNGANKQHYARLNEDGSIDTTFNTNVLITNVAVVNDGPPNKTIALSDGKILIATYGGGTTGLYPPTPLKLNPDGSRDTSFNPSFAPPGFTINNFDLFVQPDGKIVVGGNTGGSGYFGSFVVRLNSDGTVDSGFQINQEAQKTVRSLAQHSDGKIIVSKTAAWPLTLGEVVRLNADGSADPTFNAGAGANGKINALLVLPNGKILVGGKFTQFNNQPRQNLALLGSDGKLDGALVNVNEEVLSLTLDNEGRILVGGAFTVINSGGGFATRTYIARLLASTQNGLTRTRFDFDGDRRADLAVFDASTGAWSIRLSITNQTTTTVFGQQGDVTAPADFDGDGRADIAVYRPAEGVFYLSQSSAGFRAVRWGALEDKPVPADYDGDGRADIAVWRPSNGVWYILNSQTNQLRAVHFGKAGDVALQETDFDGDGRADIAVYRPSTGAWYWLESGANDQLRAVLFGQIGDIAAAADYNADGKTDFAVFRPNGGGWYRQLSTPNGGYTFSALPFGQSGDVPVVADYNGDGSADISIRRADFWHLLLSGQGHTGASFGRADEQPVAAPQP